MIKLIILRGYIMSSKFHLISQSSLKADHRFVSSDVLNIILGHLLKSTNFLHDIQTFILSIKTFHII